jgi:hypothetical protein
MSAFDIVACVISFCKQATVFFSAAFTSFDIRRWLYNEGLHLYLLDLPQTRMDRETGRATEVSLAAIPVHEPRVRLDVI